MGEVECMHGEYDGMGDVEVGGGEGMYGKEGQERNGEGPRGMEGRQSWEGRGKRRAGKEGRRGEEEKRVPRLSDS